MPRQTLNHSKKCEYIENNIYFYKKMLEFFSSCVIIKPYYS